MQYSSALKLQIFKIFIPHSTLKWGSGPIIPCGSPGLAIEASDHEGPEPQIPPGHQPPPRARSPVGLYIALARSPMAFSPKLFSDQKPSWHVGKLTPKSSYGNCFLDLRKRTQTNFKKAF